MASYDIIGNIAIIKSEQSGVPLSSKQKLKQAKELLSKPSIKTVLEKSSNVKGRLRTIKTKHIAGIKNTIAIYKENNCTFKLDVETCYFSPRLSNDRLEIARSIKMSDKVLVMFAGVGPYPIVIYKTKKPKQITTIELSKECNKYLKENLKLNKIPESRITTIQGDVKKKITKQLGKFDKIIMTRPNLKQTFLKQALQVSKRKTKIFYHLFCHQDNLDKEIKKLEKEATREKHKIKIKKIKKAGVIAPYKFRYQLEIEVVK